MITGEGNIAFTELKKFFGFYCRAMQLHKFFTYQKTIHYNKPLSHCRRQAHLLGVHFSPLFILWADIWLPIH